METGGHAAPKARHGHCFLRRVRLDLTITASFDILTLSLQNNRRIMMQQSLIQIRVDRPLKEEVSEIFSALGIDISTAVRMFLQRCRRVKGIPFALTVQDPPLMPRIGISKGKWNFPADWEAQDKALDAEIAKDFYADSL
jgi:DNA-damage-inducible protein J